ncbi:MAG: 50S ribosomal protein L4 [Anaerolinea thermophila]|uniref:Large ribosomal subunit protein uL4 n=1 Tax=Anaerolinea thermophila TaxID=167964 RepID=A0A101FZ04_9CHLR|nr:MAG: 50S ribosomal protein L4 [Anaerolinea thermophila]
MKVDVIDFKGKKIGDMELPKDIFEANVNVDLMHQAYVRQMANARLGTHETKERGDVSGGGRKPWRQKGTGRARQGSIRAAQWVGGGKIFTPHMRSYEKKMPLKMRRAALRSALTVKAGDGEIIIVDSVAMDQPKSKILAQAVEKWVGENTALLVMPSKAEENVFISARNLKGVKVLHANYLNIRDLLTYDRVVLDKSSITVIEEYLGKGK